MVPMNDDTADRLAGQHILVVEDEVLLALDIADEVERAGGDVEMASSSRQALRLISMRHFDVAVLDFQLTDGTSMAVAEELSARHVPFFFLTAQGQLPETPPQASQCRDLRQAHDGASDPVRARQGLPLQIRSLSSRFASAASGTPAVPPAGSARPFHAISSIARPFRRPSCALVCGLARSRPASGTVAHCCTGTQSVQARAEFG